LTGLTRVLAAATVTTVIGGSIVGGGQLAGHGVIVNYPAGHDVRKLPAVAASAWVIADASTGAVLAAKDPHGYYRPASTLKVLTAVALIPELRPDQTVTASRLAASQTPNDIGLLAGHSYKVSDLFTALLTISANDAAVALAQGTGSCAHGMALINAEARRLRALDTVAMDPNGLDEPGQHTSAYDLALIARQALKMPAFMKYDTVTGGLFPIKARKSVGLWNQNGLLPTAAGGGYRGGIGGKIGWTSAAGATYVGMARRGGVTLIVALLHCPPLTEITSAEKLLDWGFAMDGKVKPIGTLVPPLTPGAGGAAAGHAGSTAGKPSAGTTMQVRHVAAVRNSGLASPTALTAIGVGGAAVLAAAGGLVYSRRRRSPLCPLCPCVRRPPRPTTRNFGAGRGGRGLALAELGDGGRTCSAGWPRYTPPEATPAPPGRKRSPSTNATAILGPPKSGAGWKHRRR
jgi:D-alanyl-D-alanine carboxypeptidase (penicillin-binding protein 5/6)